MFLALFLKSYRKTYTEQGTICGRRNENAAKAAINEMGFGFTLRRTDCRRSSLRPASCLPSSVVSLSPILSDHPQLRHLTSSDPLWNAFFLTFPPFCPQSQGSNLANPGLGGSTHQRFHDQTGGEEEDYSIQESG